jgi:hypothetical protein
VYLLKTFINCTSFFHWLYSPLWTLASAFQFHDHFTDGRTPWTSNQLVARPLPKHRTTQTQNKHTHTHQIPMHCVGFEPTIPASERAKAVHEIVPLPDVIIIIKSSRIKRAEYVTHGR